MMSKRIQLSDHFTINRLLRFAFPSIVMMVFASIYTVIDGIFVSNFAGEAAFAGLNFVFPYCMVMSAFCFMIGSGSSALVGKLLGEGKQEKAKSVFSLSIYFSIVLSLVMMGIGLALIEPITKLRHASGELLTQSLIYGRIYLCGTVFYSIQMEFQNLFVTAEKPRFGFLVTIIGGVSNIVLDALFIIVFKWGVAGAASATILAQFIAASIGIIYFLCPNSSLLRLGKTTIDIKAIWKICTNGISELFSNISMALVGLVFNNQLLKYLGEDGVSAYGVLMYVSFIYVAIVIGYVIGVAPIFSYHFGAKNTAELHSLFKKSLILIAINSIMQVLIAELMAGVFSSWFIFNDPELFKITKRAFLLYSFGFLFAGLCIFASCFFTALNDGLTSGFLSLMRTLVLQIVLVLIFPLWWGVDGIWLSYFAAETISAIICIVFFIIKKKKYGY